MIWSVFYNDWSLSNIGVSDQRLSLRHLHGDLEADVRGLRVLALALAQQLAVGQRGGGREAGGHLGEARHVLIRAVN